MPIIEYLSLPILGYLFGSISSAIVICRMMGLPDPRIEGSGNPGATNVLRLGGKKAAIITLVFDFLKGLIPVVIATALSANDWVVAATGFAAFIGHLYPVFFRFQGGKGVATALGVYFGFSLWLGLAALAIWLFFALATRYSSLASLIAVTLTPVLTSILRPGFAFLIATFAIGVLVYIRHRTNIQRLLAGNESKINLKKRPSAQDPQDSSDC